MNLDEPDLPVTHALRCLEEAWPRKWHVLDNIVEIAELGWTKTLEILEKLNQKGVVEKAVISGQGASWRLKNF